MKTVSAITRDARRSVPDKHIRGAKHARLLISVISTMLAVENSCGAPVTGDFDGDGAADVVIHDAESGTFAVGYDIMSPQPDWREIDVRGQNHFNGRFLRAADLNGEQGSDLYVASREANRVFVFAGLADRARGFAADAFIVGAGPAGAGLAPGALAGELPLAVPLSAESAPRLRIFQPAKPDGAGASWPLPAAMGGLDWLDFSSGAATTGGKGSPPLLLSALQRRPGDSALSVFWKPAAGAVSPPATATFREAFQRLEAPVFADGFAAAPSIIAWGEDHDELAVVSVVPPPAAGSPSIDVETQKLKRLIDVRKVPAADRDLVAVLFADGTAAVYRKEGGVLVEQDVLTLPGGVAIGGLAALPGGRLLTLTPGPGGTAFVLEDNGAGYEILTQCAVPAPPVLVSTRQVVLLSAPPFGSEPALELESFAVGHWASKISLDGNDIEGLQEFFGGSSAGLISPSALSFTATVTPGPTATSLGNQMTGDSCLFHGGPPAADGAAAVSVSPPEGTYAGTVALTFSAAPGVTVRYRLDGQAWSTAKGPVFLTQSAVLEFFGRAPNGDLSAIRRGEYIITQDLQADANGDGVPDAIAIRAGLDPFGPPDSDGDSFPDRDELLAGFDPLNAASHPAELLRPDTREIVVACAVPNGSGGEDAPAAGTELRMTTLDGGLIAVAAVEMIDGQPLCTFRVQTATRFVVIESPEIFALAGDPSGATRGRRVSAVGSLPPLAPLEGPVDLTAPDPVAVWRTGMNESIAAGGNHTEFVLDTASTVVALAFEAWLALEVGELLGGWAGEGEEGEQEPHIIGAPGPGARHRISESDLAMLGAASMEDLEAFDTGVVFDTLAEAVNAPAGAPLRSLMTAIHTFAAGAPADDLSLLQPATMVRDILHGGAPTAGYATAVSAADVNNARAAWSDILALPAPREVIQVAGTLDTSGFSCLMLLLDDRTLLELREADGSAWWRAANFPVIAGAGASLTGLAMPLAPECGDLAVQVLDLQVTSVPPPPDNDADGDGLDDSFEEIFLGGMGAGFWEDADGDGFVNGEEQLGATDPASRAMFPANPPATPAEMTSEFSTDGNGAFTLQWDGSPVATYRVWVSADLTTWTESPVLPVQGPPGHFVWLDPSSSPDIRFHRVAITLPGTGE
jgi:hypothetical protein